MNDSLKNKNISKIGLLLKNIFWTFQMLDKENVLTIWVKMIST